MLLPFILLGLLSLSIRLGLRFGLTQIIKPEYHWLLRDLGPRYLASGLWALLVDVVLRMLQTGWYIEPVAIWLFIGLGSALILRKRSQNRMFERADARAEALSSMRG